MCDAWRADPRAMRWAGRTGSDRGAAVPDAQGIAGIDDAGDTGRWPRLLRA